MKNGVIGALIVIVVVLASLLLFGGSTDDATVDSNSNSETTKIQTSGDTKSLADQGLETVPQSLFNDKSITSLDLSGNNLTGALPGEIRHLSKLEYLDASDNNLTGIPAEIGQLSKLRYIDFSDNDISGLPNELGNLSNLETLDLRGNPNVSELDLSTVQADIPQAEILTDL